MDLLREWAAAPHFWCSFAFAVPIGAIVVMRLAFLAQGEMLRRRANGMPPKSR